MNIAIYNFPENRDIIIDIIAHVLNSNQYFYIQDKLPQLYINCEYIAVMDIRIRDVSFLDLKHNLFLSFKAQMNSCIYCFNRTFKNNALDESLFMEFLNKFSNLKNDPLEMTIKNDYDYKESKIKKVDQEGIIDQIKDLYSQFKANHSQPNIRTINKLIFTSNKKDDPLLNGFFFTLLEIIIDMKIEIEELKFIGFTFNEVGLFMNKLKTIESLYINNIFIHNPEKDIDEVDDLYQYSHLIEGKLKVHLEYYTNLFKLYFSNIVNKNFIEFCKSSGCLIIKKNYSINRDNRLEYLKKLNNELNFYEENNYFSRIINDLYIKLAGIDLDYIFKLFSFYKKYKFVILKCKFDYDSIGFSQEIRKKINYIYLETILEIKYQEIIYDFYSYETYTLKRKAKRYIRLHNIKY